MQQALMDRVAPWLDKVTAVAPIATAERTKP